ncbi:hypothetical protein BDK51DRAFT_42727 [Blyttiomyces helicus]|uniref:Ankyrin repeat-containing domain protein n=1 Tax=Blyttiomyces helicus TaxID=388810 RepID=A0A4V1IRE1_9FUNG|nr:hypothetical protein BDK51DRAFT_42727 [Blyttiomyces helicus]|eukprot:RKO89737.1 hypothetical protein BDK51DRAFT_42727 [Blyttiomyces helicus]
MPPVIAAIARNRWDAVRFLVEAGFDTSRAVDAAACSRAHLGDIVYLIARGGRHAAFDAICHAVIINDVSLVRLLHSNGIAVLDEQLIVTARSRASREMVSCLMEISAQVPPQVEAMNHACKHGYVERVRFLLATHPAIDYRFALPALNHRHVEVLRVLYQKGVSFTDEEVKRIFSARIGKSEGDEHAFLREQHMSRVPCCDASLLMSMSPFSFEDPTPPSPLPLNSDDIDCWSVLSAPAEELQEALRVFHIPASLTPPLPVLHRPPVAVGILAPVRAF